MFRRRRTRISRQAVIFLLLSLFIFTVLRLFVVIDQNIRPTVVAIIGVRADLLATQAINNAITEKIAQTISYQDLIHLTKDKEGKIVLAQINTMEVNSISADTTMYVQNALLALSREKIYIPMGQIFNSFIFSHAGPNIPITISPVGYVTTTIDDQFEDAGINQVRHKIYMIVETDVQVVIPFVAEVTKVTTTVPIVDAIYPGEVPDTVINLDFPNSIMPPGTTD